MNGHQFPQLPIAGPGAVCRGCGRRAAVLIGSSRTPYCGDNDADLAAHRADEVLHAALDEHLEQAFAFLRSVPAKVLAEAFRQLDAEEPGQAWDRAAKSVERMAGVRS